MSRIAFSRVKKTQELLSTYTGEQPFHLYLSGFFLRNKQMGSKDRKVIRALCYAYFRLGKAFETVSFEHRLHLALFLTTSAPDEVTDYLTTVTGLSFEPREFVLSVQEKLQRVSCEAEDIFPYHEHISNLAHRDRFITSLLQQPLVWLRLRKQKVKDAEARLLQKGITHTLHPQVELARGVAAATQLETPDTATVWEVQDVSSQQVFHGVPTHNWGKVWDACAASGGKSLLLHEQNCEMDLYVSDVREHILHNLKGRFQRNGISHYFSATVNLNEPHTSLRFTQQPSGQKTEVPRQFFDAIIADVPCSGSGTWGRTPEQISFFAEYRIDAFSSLQRDILYHMIPFLKPGGTLMYITCSVFAEENEHQVAWLQQQGFVCKHMRLIEGFSHQADTLFAAELIKSF